MIASASRSAALAVFLSIAALPCGAQDVTPPNISSVVVSPTTVAPGDTVHISAAVTDDVGVASVRSGAVAFERTGGDTWEGVIAVEPALGEHFVTVQATDAAGNVSTDEFGHYTTAQVIGIRCNQALSQTVIFASAGRIMKVWGRATYRDENTFSVMDGTGSSVYVDAPGHGVCNGDFVAARGILDATAPPARLTQSVYHIFESATRTPINIANTSVGKDLQTPLSGSLNEPVPYGTTLPITLISSDPGKVRLSRTATDAGGATIVIAVPGGSSAIPTFYVHGLASGGTAEVIATAPGCRGTTFTVTLAPSGFYIDYPSSINTTSFSGNTEIGIRSARLNPVSRYVVQNENLRGGLAPVEVTVASTLATVGTITASPLTFAGNEGLKKTWFDPVNPGQTAVQVTTPPGFTQPADDHSLTALVTAPGISLPNQTVGLDLQTSVSVALDAAPPWPVDVTVSITSPSTATLSTDPADAGGASLSFPGVTTTQVGTIYIHGRGLGQTQIAASATGYNTRTSTVTVDPSGFYIESPGSISTTTFSGNTTVTIRSGRLNPSTLGVAAYQKLRGGIAPVSVYVTSSNPSVGTITNSPLTFTANTGQMTTEFDPIGDGTSTVSVAVPPGFTEPVNNRQIAAVVTAPGIRGYDEVVGDELQIGSSTGLEVSPPQATDLTVSVDQPSIATITKSATAEGTQSIVFASLTNTASQNFYVQGRSMGTATVSFSAPGYATTARTITVRPSGFVILSPASIDTTVYSSSSTVSVASAQLNPATLAWEAYQNVRGGVSGINVEVTSADPGVGVITTSPVTFTSNTSSRATAFDPTGLGSTTVRVLTPAGFSAPSNRTQISALVDQPEVVASDETVGRDLQVTSSVRLEAAPPSPVDITVTVGSTSVATISRVASQEGTGSATFAGVSSAASQTLYIQGRGIGTTTLTASAPGYVTTIRTVAVHPSGFVIFSPGNFSTTASSANTTVQVGSARLNPADFTFVAYQPVRGGLSVGIDVTSSDMGVGVVTASPIAVPSATTYATTAFDPLAVGTSVISVEVPLGFSTPTTKRQITATVNP